MHNNKNGTNHEEVSCGMDHIVLYRIYLEHVSWNSVVCLGWFSPKFRLCCLITSLRLLLCKQKQHSQPPWFIAGMVTKYIVLCIGRLVCHDLANMASSP